MLPPIANSFVVPAGTATATPARAVGMAALVVQGVAVFEGSNAWTVFIGPFVTPPTTYSTSLMLPAPADDRAVGIVAAGFQPVMTTLPIDVLLLKVKVPSCLAVAGLNVAVIVPVAVPVLLHERFSVNVEGRLVLPVPSAWTCRTWLLGSQIVSIVPFVPNMNAWEMNVKEPVAQADTLICGEKYTDH